MQFHLFCPHNQPRNKQWLGDLQTGQRMQKANSNQQTEWIVKPESRYNVWSFNKQQVQDTECMPLNRVCERVYRVSQKSIIYLNTDITSNAQMDALGLCDTCVYWIRSFKAILNLKQKEKRYTKTFHT